MNMKDLRGRITGESSAEAAPGDTARTIRELAALLSETGLTEIEVEQNGQRLRVARQSAPVTHAFATPGVATPVAAAASPAADAPVAKGPHPGAVPSPMVGTVYVAPEPGKPAFVKVGSTVKEGDTLFIVEAMKTMNPILAPKAGTVQEICVHDADPVEFGQTLLILS